MLTGEQKKAIVQILYTYPNKLLHFMLKDIDVNYDKIIKDILASEPKTKKGLLITEGMLCKELQNQSVAYIMSIYDFIASTATSNTKTLSDLNRKDYFDFEANTNYQIQNIMMEENVGNFHNMATKAETLYKNVKLDISKQMIALVVRKYFLTHDITMIGEAQHIIDVFFGKDEEQKRTIRMIQAKNKVVKK